MKQGALIYDPCMDRMDIRFGLNTYLGGPALRRVLRCLDRQPVGNNED